MNVSAMTTAYFRSFQKISDTDVQEAEALVKDLFAYHKPDDSQKKAFVEVRESLAASYMTILEVVPPGPARTRALNAITDARMVANQAIVFKGEI